MTLRVVFMGSPEFSVPTLRALHSNFSVAGVVSQPDKPKGRGRKTFPTPVKAAAVEIGVPVITPQDVCSEESLAFLKECDPQVIVVAAYGRILPEQILELPAMGCVNLHASLLPRHRGASPISAAILAGDEVTGVCSIAMDQGMDTGDILLQTEIMIAEGDTAGSLHDRMLEPGADLIVKTLKAMAQARIRPAPQDHEKATYTRPLSKNDGRIDWRRDARHISCLVRAMNPWPAASTQLSGDWLKVWEAAPQEGQGGPGTIVDIVSHGILVGTGQGLLLLKQIQAPGKKRMEAANFARGRRLKQGDSFGESD